MQLPLSSHFSINHYFIGKVEEGNNENNYSGEGKWSWDVAKRFEMPSCAFVLPNLSELAPEFRRFLEEDLIETTILKKLENSGSFETFF